MHDIPDIPIIKLAGIGCCPQDAVPEIKAVSNYISQKNGGGRIIGILVSADRRLLAKEALVQRAQHMQIGVRRFYNIGRQGGESGVLI